MPAPPARAAAPAPARGRPSPATPTIAPRRAPQSPLPRGRPTGGRVDQPRSTAQSRPIAPSTANERLHVLLPVPARRETYADLAARIVRALRAAPSVGHALGPAEPGFVRMRYGAAVGDDVAWLV